MRMLYADNILVLYVNAITNDRFPLSVCRIPFPKKQNENNTPTLCYVL
jgi:hypothetical protein